MYLGCVRVMMPRKMQVCTPMYVCMYVLCMYVCIVCVGGDSRSSYIHTYIQAYIRTCPSCHARMAETLNPHTYIHTYIPALLVAPIWQTFPTVVNSHTYTNTSIHTYIHKYKHTYIHTYIPALHCHAHMANIPHSRKFPYIHEYKHTYIHTNLPFLSRPYGKHSPQS